MSNFFIMLAIFVVIAVVTAIVTVRSRKAEIKFDERQQIARGRAFEAGFYTLMLTLLGYIFCNNVMDISVLGVEIGIALCIIVSVGVFAMVGVLKDAFLEFNSSAKARGFFFGVLGGINLALGVWAVLDGRLFENGQLSLPVLNLSIGGLMLVVVACIAVRNALQKKQAAIEESEDE